MTIVPYCIDLNDHALMAEFHLDPDHLTIGSAQVRFGIYQERAVVLVECDGSIVALRAEEKGEADVRAYDTNGSPLDLTQE